MKKLISRQRLPAALESKTTITLTEDETFLHFSLFHFTTVEKNRLFFECKQKIYFPFSRRKIRQVKKFLRFRHVP